MTDYQMKDSGQREEFTTGAVRDSREGKGRYDLIPVIALKRVAAVYEKGASKYTPRNWEAGLSQSRCYDSALRHLMQYAEGLRDEDHLAQAAFNVLAMIFTEEQVNRGNLPASLMDLPSYVKAMSNNNATRHIDVVEKNTKEPVWHEKDSNRLNAWVDQWFIRWPTVGVENAWRDNHSPGTPVPVTVIDGALYAVPNFPWNTR